MAEPILDILRINEVIVYFAYGQVFFVLGVIIALQSRKHSRLALARHLKWLAAFGIAHGLNEWAHVFIPIQASYLPADTVAILQAIHTLTLAFSFYLLLQFGTLVAFSRSDRWSLVRFLPLGLFLTWLALSLRLSGTVPGGFFKFLQSPDAEASARLLLGYSGAAIASFGMLRQARLVKGLRLPRIAWYFRWTSVWLGLYAIVGGMVASPGTWLSEQWSGLLFAGDIVTVPAPLLRSIAALGIAFGVVRGLNVFELETDRLIEEAERNRIRAADRARLALDAIAAAVSRPLRIDALVDVALEKMLEIMGASSGWAMLVRPDNGELEVLASRGLSGSIAPGVPCTSIQDCVCRQIVMGIEAGSVRHISDCRLRSEAETSDAFISVPLKAQDRVVGIINIADRNYGTEELGLLASIGKQIGLAVENARLWDELHRKEEARTQLLGRVIAAQEDERRRVARELHDETGQSLSAVIMGLGAASENVSRDPKKAEEILRDTREIAVDALDGIRQLILGLRPAILDDLGLAPALRRLAEDLSKRSPTRIQVFACGVDERMPPEVETVLFRILQEGMNNVARHSGACSAVLRLARHDSDVEASLEDDGVGFDLAEVTTHLETGRGLGIAGMRERASLLGGEVVVDSVPGRGTRLQVRLPIVERN